MSSPIAAFFDVDGTLTKTILLQPLLWYLRARRSRLMYAAYVAELALHLPRYVWIDRRSRTEFNHLFFRRYRGLPADDLRQWHRNTFPENLQRTLFPDAVACVRQHQEQGHRIVLVTGGLDFVMAPLVEYLRADTALCMHLEERDGEFTGKVATPPVADEEKAILVRQYAREHQLELSQCHAYGNNWGDVPMLACVGLPTAVNPDDRLRKWAEEHSWPSVRWSHRGSRDEVRESP
jgi:HAD superfamily hydrolase (TIGR01490 family)